MAIMSSTTVSISPAAYQLQAHHLLLSILAFLSTMASSGDEHLNDFATSSSSSSASNTGRNHLNHDHASGDEHLDGFATSGSSSSDSTTGRDHLTSRDHLDDHHCESKHNLFIDFSTSSPSPSQTFWITTIRASTIRASSISTTCG